MADDKTTKPDTLKEDTSAYSDVSVKIDNEYVTVKARNAEEAIKKAKAVKE